MTIPWTLVVLTSLVSPACHVLVDVLTFVENWMKAFLAAGIIVFGENGDIHTACMRRPNQLTLGQS